MDSLCSLMSLSGTGAPGECAPGLTVAGAAPATEAQDQMSSDSSLHRSRVFQPARVPPESRFVC